MAKYICGTCGAKQTNYFGSPPTICKKKGCGGAMSKVSKTSGGTPKAPELHSTATPPLGTPTASALKPASPRVDLSELNTRVTKRVEDAVASASVSKTLVFTMDTGSSVIPFNYPYKYRLWISDRGQECTEITVEIPIKVYSGATALPFWESKGYSADDFARTAHVGPSGGKELGVQAATATKTVLDAWSTKINNCWGKVGIMWTKPSRQERLYGLKFAFKYVENASDAAAEVICTKTTGAAAGLNPTGTIDAIRWGVDDVDPKTFGPICHEVGHLIGNPDEYFTITYNGVVKAWGAGYQTGPEHFIMNNPDRGPKIEYYKPLAIELADKFSIPHSEAEVLEDYAMPSSCRRHRLDAHIWA